MRRQVTLTVLIVSFALSISPALAQKPDKTLKLFPISKNGKCGFIDKQGHIVVAPQLGECDYPFQEGLAPVKLNGKFGFIDEAGRVVIKPIFNAIFNHNPDNIDFSPEAQKASEKSSVDYFRDGLAQVVIDHKVGFVNKTGAFAIEPQFFQVGGGFADGLAAVWIGRKRGFVASIKNGKLTLGTEPGWVGKAMGYIDRTGKVVIKPSFDGTYYFAEGLAPVQIGREMGLHRSIRAHGNRPSI